MEKIKVTTKKYNGYYHAVLIVTSSNQRYISKDMFLTEKTALKQALWWKYESLLLSQIIDY